MSRIDWQAFDDGSMSSGERASAEALLRDSAEARAELEAFHQFKAGVREAGLSEKVPIERLERALGGLQRRPTRSPYFVGASLAAAAVLIWFMISFISRPLPPDPMRLDQTPALASLTTSDPQVGRRWMIEATGYPLPVVDLTSAGEMQGVHRGEQWTSYEYKVGQDVYTIGLCPCGHHFEDLPKVSLASGFEVAEGQGIGFTIHGACIHVRGPDKEISRRLALQIHQQLVGSKETWGLSGKNTL